MLSAWWGVCLLPIRAGGTGEIVYQQLGATRSAIARSEDGEAIAKKEEVYVIRYEKGIAYVRRWEDLGANDGFAGNKDPVGAGVQSRLAVRTYLKQAVPG